MLDNSVVEVLDDTSYDGANPGMWGVFVGGEDWKLGRFICTYCFRIVEAKFPRYFKVLDKIHDIDDKVLEKWRSPCCAEKIERVD